MKAHTKETQAAITPLSAIEILKDGNRRFVKSQHADRDLLEQVADTATGQYPFATILSCIDS
ncbi:MAG: carbonic anhydrase, partial [Flavobacteriaceae bacterium]